jgi:hypothetical protein
LLKRKQDIVEAASHEKDQEKLKTLAEELELALDGRAEKFFPPQPTPLKSRRQTA